MASDPRLDPEVEPGVALMNDLLDWSGVTLEGIPAFRERLADSLTAAMDAHPPSPAVHVEDRTIPGPDGAPDLRVRIKRPVDQSGDLPCIYRIHGGGMIIGSIDDEHPSVSSAVEQLGCVLVSVEYRLAPENPYPAQVDDCYAGLCWVAEQAGALGIDGARLVIAGESAGGGLAAAVALMARDRNGPRPSFQYLIYPMLDDRNETPSSREFTGDWPGWPREMNILGWRALLGTAAHGHEIPAYAAPARASDLRGLPPAYIDCGGLEVFRDEVIDHAQRLMQAGVPVEFHCWPGVFHGWELVAPDAAITERALAVRYAALRRALHP